MRFAPKALAITMAVASLAGTRQAAAAPHLGSTYKSVKADYAQAAVTGTANHGKVLELREVDYAGIRWDRVDFQFDAQDRLATLSLHTGTARYETVLAMAQMQSQQPDGVASTTDSVGDDMQVRVCEGDDGAVTMTYEPAASPT